LHAWKKKPPFLGPFDHAGDRVQQPIIFHGAVQIPDFLANVRKGSVDLYDPDSETVGNALLTDDVLPASSVESRVANFIEKSMGGRAGRFDGITHDNARGIMFLPCLPIKAQSPSSDVKKDRFAVQRTVQ